MVEVCRQRAKPGGQPGRGWPCRPCGEAVRGRESGSRAAVTAGDRAGAGTSQDAFQRSAHQTQPQGVVAMGPGVSW